MMNDTSRLSTPRLLLALAALCSIGASCGHGHGGGSDAGLGPLPTSDCDDPIKQSSTLCPIAAGSPLPVGLANAAGVIEGGHAYLIGGTQAENEIVTQPEVYVAQLGTNDTLGTWATTAPLPKALSRVTAAASNGFIYALGGIVAHGGTTIQKSVFVGTIAADGTITAWAAGPDLPGPRAAGAAVIVNNFLYFLGGYPDNRPVADVYVAPINADGTLGAWKTTTALPTGRMQFSALENHGRIYVVAGSYQNSAATCEASTVLVGTVNADGTIEGWQTTSTWAEGVFSGAASIVNDTLVVGGGFVQRGDKFVQTSSVVAAPITVSDGSVGKFKFIAALPVGNAALGGASSATAAWFFGGNPSGAGGLATSATAVKVAGGTNTCSP